MKMLSADDGTPALDPGSGAVPAWPVVSETAGASSSSSGGGGIIAQPMAVESDLTHTRGLKISLDVADMEIAEVCSFIFVLTRTRNLILLFLRWFSQMRENGQPCRQSSHVLTSSRRRKTCLEIKPLELC